MEPIYIRTDRNGTKIYHDYTCPRCGGAGESDKWLFTGKVCFECGGSGKRSHPLVVKEYTEEYAAKLEAKRIAKQRKYEEEHADEIAQAKSEREEREAKWKKEQNEYLCKTLGCNGDGIGYVLTGNTYRMKDKIRANGGKWYSQAWVCPVEMKASGVYSVRINIYEFSAYGLIKESIVRDVVYCISQKGMNLEEAKAQANEWDSNK